MWNLIRIQVWSGQGLPTYQSTTVPADGGKSSSRVFLYIILTLLSCRFLRDRTFSSLSAGRRTGSACITSLGWRARYSSDYKFSVWMSYFTFPSQDGERDRETSWVDQRGRPQLCGPLQDCQVREDQVPRYWWASSPTICASVISIFFTVMSDLLLNALTNQYFSAEGLYWDLRLGTEALSQVHGI